MLLLTLSTRLCPPKQRNIFAKPDVPVINGPPKLVIWDIATNSLVRMFVFPNSAASYDSSFLNDIVLVPMMQQQWQ